MRSRTQTDVGNSERFVAEHSGHLRYVGPWRKHVEWDGRRWTLDTTDRAVHYAKETARRMLDQARGSLDALLQQFGEGDEETRAKGKARVARATSSVTWALKTHEARRINAMVQLARSAPELAITHDAFDSDPWLLNVANGTIDLRTQKLRRHDPRDLITKLAPVAYDPHASCPAWERFLARVMADDAATIDFVRRMLGYALTGVIREHVLSFFFGDGANGKSTAVTTWHALLGDYAVRAPRGLLFRARGERHETELTTLFGARFVSCAEIDKDAVFDEALVKDLTGGDPITARRMREDHWSFSPAHKLFLAGNHKPRVRGADEGIWRRIRLVPFTVTIPEAERDPDLPLKLRDELPGILAWAVRGCADWQVHGLGGSSAVRVATDDYREASDPLREFFALHCVFELDERVPRKQIRAAYEEYCRENGAEPLGAKRFAEGLRRRGVTDRALKHQGKVLDGWRGVRLATESERSRADAVGGRDQVGPDSRMTLIDAPGNGVHTETAPYEVPTPYSEDDGEHAFSDMVGGAE